MKKEELEMLTATDLRKFAADENIKIPGNVKSKPALVDFIFDEINEEKPKSKDEDSAVTNQPVTEAIESNSEPDESVPAAGDESKEDDSEKEATVETITAYGKLVYDRKTGKSEMIPNG